MKTPMTPAELCREVRRLREAATQGEWTAKKSGNGHDIVAKRMQYSEQQFIDDAHMYHLPERRQIQWQLGEDGFLYASLSYETWRQFPSKEWDILQAANAEFIAFLANNAMKLVEAVEAERRHSDRLAEALKSKSYHCVCGDRNHQNRDLLAEHERMRQ